MEIHRIVVLLDGSVLAEKALPFATKLAKSLDAKILLLRSAKSGRLHPQTAENELEILNSAEAYLEQVRDAITSPTAVTPIEAAKVRNLVIYKEPLQELPQVAAFEKAELIVMTTHGRTGLARMVLGSAASAVLQHSSLPVVLIRPETLEQALPLQETLTGLANLALPEEGERLIVTLDGSDTAELALPPAIELARQLNATLYLLQVIPPYTPLYYADIGVAYEYDEKFAEQEAADRRETASKYLDTVRDDVVAQGLKCVKLVHEGNPGLVIAGYAQALQASMLVMATHARNSAGRALLGSVADEVMRVSNLPVLMVNTRLYPKPPVQTAPATLAAI